MGLKELTMGGRGLHSSDSEYTEKGGSCKHEINFGFHTWMEFRYQMNTYQFLKNEAGPRNYGLYKYTLSH